MNLCYFKGVLIIRIACETTSCSSYVLRFCNMNLFDVFGGLILFFFQFFFQIHFQYR